MYLATLFFSERDGSDPREFFVFADSIEEINEKISKAKAYVVGRGFSSVGHIIEEIPGVSASDPRVIDFYSKSGNLIH